MLLNLSSGVMSRESDDQYLGLTVASKMIEWSGSDDDVACALDRSSSTKGSAGFQRYSDAYASAVSPTRVQAYS